jgi:hypothetical protein
VRPDSRATILGDPGGWRGALRFGAGDWATAAREAPAVGPGRQRERTSRSAAAPVGDATSSRARRCTAVHGAPPLRRRLSVPADDNGKGKESCPSLPLLTYSAPGGLRQDPGRAAESAARPRADEDMGPQRRVLLSTDGGRGDEPLTGPVVRLRALGAEMRVCAPPDWSGGRQRGMRTCRTRGSTLAETPVVGPAGAGQRSTAVSEVSR